MTTAILVRNEERGENKIMAIKALRAISGTSLRDAKDTIDATFHDIGYDVIIGLDETIVDKYREEISPTAELATIFKEPLDSLIELGYDVYLPASYKEQVLSIVNSAIANGDYEIAQMMLEICKKL